MIMMLNDHETADVHNCSNFIYVPLCYQETEFTCGVACAQSILAYYGIQSSQSSLADILHSQPIIGTDPQSILFLMQLLGFKASMHDNMEIKDIKNYIDAGITPMLVIQAWKSDKIEYSYDWKNAHYVIACGYYRNGIYAMDPYTLGNYTCLPFSELLDRWHAVDKSGARHFNCGLIVQPDGCSVKYNHKEIKPLE